MKCPSYEYFFDVIAQKSRMKIITALKKKPMCVSDICNEIGEEQSKVSHNLKKLIDCRFLTVNQKGKRRYYSLNKETIVPLLSLAEKHVKKFCCKSCIKRGQ